MWGNLIAIVKIGLELWKMHRVKKDDPNNQNLERKQELGKAIAAGDATAVNLALHDMLERLRNPAANGNPKR